MCFLQGAGALRAPSHSSGDALCGCGLYPHPVWDPHLGCSAFTLELCGLLPCICSCRGPCVRRTCPSALCHPGDAALLLDGDMKSSWGGSGEGGVPMVTDSDSPDGAGRVFRPFLFFSSGVGHPAKELKEQWHSLARESREDKSGLVKCTNPSRAQSPLQPWLPPHR